MLSQYVGANIKKYRKQKGWKQEKLAFALRFTRQYVSLIEHGHINIGVNTLQQIADALNVNVIQFFDDNRPS